MKTTTIWRFIGFAIVLLFTISCGSEQRPKNLDKSQYVESTDQDQEKEFKYEYQILSFIGEDRWGSFQKYYDFAKNKENHNQLFIELEHKGYDKLTLMEIFSGLLLADSRPDTISLVHSNGLSGISLSSYFMGWLYVKMREADVNTGTYKDYKKDLENADGFMWYYNKSLELGLVRNWFQFLSMMFIPEGEDEDENFKFVP